MPLVMRPVKRVMLLAVLCLTGCQSLRAPPVNPELPLLAPQLSQLDLQANQKLMITADGETHAMIGMLLLTPGQSVMTGLEPAGRRLITIRYDGIQLETEVAAALDYNIPGNIIMAMMQLTYWPTGALMASYSGDWELVNSDRQRSLFLRGRRVITVTYRSTGRQNTADSSLNHPSRAPKTEEAIRIEHHMLDLILDITTLQVLPRAGVNP